MDRLLTLQELERVQIIRRLAHHGYRRDWTAESLGIARRTLAHKIRQYQRQGFYIPTRGQAKKELGK